MKVPSTNILRSPLRTLLVLAVLLATAFPAVAQQGDDEGRVRLKDLVRLEGAAPLQISGYGIVVGLDRTGDRARGRRGAAYTIQSVTNMLQRFGITVDPSMLSSRNAAAVMVTATLDPFANPGSQLDVTVSSMGDAKSLSGGVLLQTPLINPATNQVHAMAQGPLSTGAVLASSRGSSVRVNHTNTGRIPGGAVITAGSAVAVDNEEVGLMLRRPDFTNATRIAEAVEAVYPDATTVVHAGLVRVQVPPQSGGASGMMAILESLTVDVDVPARVVINERTGTIVAGGGIRINEVMVTYGSLVITTQEEPFVAQPAPFGEGETVVGAAGEAGVEQEGTRSVVLPPNTSVNELAAALNELGLTARDVIAIFQSVDRAGALQGELIIQ